MPRWDWLGKKKRTSCTGALKWTAGPPKVMPICDRRKDRLSQYITLFGLRSCCSHERSFRLFSWTTPPPSNFDLNTDCAYHPLQISSCRHRMWCSLGAWRTIGNQKCQWYRWFAKVETEIYNIYTDILWRFPHNPPPTRNKDLTTGFCKPFTTTTTTATTTSSTSTIIFRWW